MKRSLLIFVKEPVAGRVKTRLTPPLSPEEACGLYECFLLDGLHQYVRISNRTGIDLQIHYSPDEVRTRKFFESCVRRVHPPGEIGLFPQRGNDLGERMANALSGAFGSGSQQAIVIGSDHPTLPDQYLMQAFERLGEPSCSAVLGKASDGGYYLIGMKELLNCFRNIPWSTETVFSDTLEQLNGKSVHILPEWYDVDDIASLMRCMSEMESMDISPSHTEEYLKTLRVLKAS